MDIICVDAYTHRKKEHTYIEGHAVGHNPAPVEMVIVLYCIYF